MSLTQIVASDRLRPLLQGVVDAIKPASVATTNDSGASASLSISPSIKVTPTLPGMESVRRIVDALIVDGGGDAAAPIADSLGIDGLGLYFIGVGSARNDDIKFESTRTDPDAPNLYLNAREGDDTISVKTADAPPPDSPAFSKAPKVTVDAGEGRDRVKVIAGIIDQVDGGEGDDIVTTRADTTSLVTGGDGNDTVSVFGRDIGTVAGGAGNDSIIAYGDLVGSVDGGAGNDQIIVGSRNISFAKGTPQQGIPVVSGGAGDDVIAIAGKAEVKFARGDGNDQVAVGETTKFNLSGFGSGQVQVVTNDDGTLSVTGSANDDGTTDSIIIESRTDTLKYIFDQVAGVLTVFTSEQAFAAADNKTPASLTEPLATNAVTVGGEDGATEVDINDDQFLRLTGAEFSEGTTFADQSDGTLITFPNDKGQLKLNSSTGPLFVDVVNKNTLALFKTEAAFNTWKDSPLNPANYSTPADELMTALQSLSQRFV